MKQFSAGQKTITIAAEIGDDEDHKAFTAMRRLFSLRNANNPVIAKMHRGDPQFWKDVIEFRKREAAKKAEKEATEAA
jgi:hypothetical protein